MSAMSTSTASDFIIQATEGIIKHLEKVDAEPEEDDFMKEDETTDFTLFEVKSINLNTLQFFYNCLISGF